MAQLHATPANLAIRFSDIDFGDFTNVTAGTSTSFRLNFSDGSYWAISGTDFTFAGVDGLPSEGSISSIDFFEPGDVQSAHITGLTLAASDLSDRVVAEDVQDLIDTAFALSDTMFGSTIGDDLRGSSASDLIVGGGGGDTLAGDDGNDLLVTASTVAAGGIQDTAYGGSGIDVLVGGAAVDSFYGDAGNDWVEGGGEDDSLNGGNDNDALTGGAGDDTSDGGDGNDYLSGGDGRDSLDGGAGNDWLDGAAGNDVFFGGDGGDFIFGGAGDDFIATDDGNNVVDAGDGSDVVFGGADNDLMQGDGPLSQGSPGSDTLFGFDGNDFLSGDGGNDILYGSSDQDTLIGGAGNDSLFGESDNDIAFGGDGNDLMQGDDGSDTLGGDSGTDDLSGGNGSDTLRGDDGNDQLTGGPGGDLLIGGAGFDAANFTGEVSVIGSSGDTMTVAGPDGIDVLVSIEQIVVPETFEIATLGSSEGFIILGDAAGDHAGSKVNAAGDLNGDGFADLVISARYGSDGGFRAGEAYVVFGTAGGFGETVTDGAIVRQIVDLTSLTGSQGFIVQGANAYDYAGSGVASAGDVNGDGFTDLIVGAFGADDGGSISGNAYVVFGTAAGFGTATTVAGVVRQVIDLATFSSSQGFVIQGDSSGDYAGISVDGAGDVNGDGFADLIVGAAGGDDGGGNAGEAYIVFGTSGSFGTGNVVDLTSLLSNQGFIIQGDIGFDKAGFSVSSAGDINGDGFDDLIVGAPLGYDGGPTAGEAYVVFGAAGGFGVAITTAGVARQVIDLTSLTSAQGFIIQGANAGDQTGAGVSSLGDINGDGYDDMIVGAPNHSDGGLATGEAYVIFGAAGGFGQAVTTAGVVRQVLDLGSLGAAQGFLIQGDHPFDFMGTAVSNAGDVNGDGFDDLLIGNRNADGPHNNDYGATYLLFGHAGGFGALDTATGIRLIDLSHLDATDGLIILGPQYGAMAGNSVAGAGDLNGDGFDDLIIGDDSDSQAGSHAGAAFVLFGAPKGSAVDTTVTGGTGNDLLIGGSADDVLISGGGLDVFRGGAGDDLIEIPGTGFADIDGGNGIDTLKLLGANQHLDLTSIGQAEIQSIERIDLTGAGNNTLTASPRDIFDLTELRGTNQPAVRVDGNSGDTVIIDEGWVSAGDTLSDGNLYERFQFDHDLAGPALPDANAELWIDKDIDVLFLS